MDKTAGIIGLGIMGMAVARNLMAAGLEVAGFDISEAAMATFASAGGRKAAGAGEVAELSEAVLTLLPSAAALHDVVGDLCAARSGATIIAECSTLPLEVKTQARDRLANAGRTLLDCPLSGTGLQAVTGDLVVLGSGPRESYDYCLPAFRALSRRQHYLGEFGNGSRMKFVANHLVNIHNVAAAEAMVLGMKAGLDPELICDVISQSAGASRMFQVRAPMMARGDYSEVSMSLALWRKDIETIAAFAAGLHCPVPLFTNAAQAYYAALAQGRGDQDTAAVCAVFEEAARVIRPPAKHAEPGTGRNT